MVQWLRLCASNAGDTGSIPGQGSSACHVVWPKKKNRKRNKIAYLYPSQHLHSILKNVEVYMYILIILRMMTSFEPSKQKTPSSLEGSGGLKNNRKILFYHIWEFYKISLENLTLGTLHLLRSERRNWGGSSGLGAKYVLTWVEC